MDGRFDDIICYFDIFIDLDLILEDYSFFRGRIILFFVLKMKVNIKKVYIIKYCGKIVIVCKFKFWGEKKKKVNVMICNMFYFCFEIIRLLFIC